MQNHAHKYGVVDTGSALKFNVVGVQKPEPTFKSVRT
jgi:hypothetical protein